MAQKSSPHLLSRSPIKVTVQQCAQALCFVVFLMGGGILAGWVCDFHTLSSLVPHAAAAKANTAFGMVLLAMATGLTLRPHPHGARLWLAYVCVLITVLMAVLTLLEHSFNIDAGIDELLAIDPTPSGEALAPGRVPRLTAMGFVMVSAALVAQTNAIRPLLDMSRVLLWLTVVLASQALVSYIVDAKVLLGAALHAQMSVHSTVMFIALCSSLLMGQRLLRSDDNVALAAADEQLQNRLVAVAIVLPPAVQSLLQIGQRAGYLTDDFGIIAQVAGNSILMLTMLHLSLAGLRTRAAQVQSEQKRFEQLSEEFKRVERERAQMHAERLMARAVRANEDRLQAMLEGAFDAVISIDAQERVTAWNGKAEKMFGWSKAQTLGHALSGFIIPIDQREAHIRGLQRYMESGQAVLLHREVEMEARRADGSLFPVRMCITPVVACGETTFTAFLSDISARRQAEHELRMAHFRAEQAAAAKSQFLAQMSHEIRTPLNGILGMTDMLIDAELTAPQRQLALVLEGAGKQLLDIVNDILDFSKAEAGHLQLEIVPFDLRDMLEQRVMLMRGRAQSKSLQLICDVADDVPTYVLGDAGRLGQVFLNLLSNAIKFTAVGSVTFRVSSMARGLRFSVQDSGIGMTPQVRQRLFQPFFQADLSTSRRFGGTGLGLAISRQLVELMGGRLEVISSVNEGSTFWFELPLQATERPRFETLDLAPQRAVLVNAEGQAPIVLVAEDNEVNRLVVSAQLRKLGCEAQLVANGQEAVEAFKNRRFDMVLMDCHMPEMDGFSATGAIRAYEADQHRHTPIVALTASALAEDVERCLLSGMDAHLCKPIRSEVFAAVVQKYFVPSDRR